MGFSVEYVLWLECIDLMTFIESQSEDSLLVPFAAQLVKELRNSICFMVKNAEQQCASFTNNIVVTVKVLADSPDWNRFICSIFQARIIPFVQVPVECRSDLTTHCTNHCTKTSFFCTVPFPWATIYRRLPRIVLARRPAVVRDQMENRATKLQNMNFCYDEQVNEMQERSKPKNFQIEAGYFMKNLLRASGVPPYSFPSLILIESSEKILLQKLQVHCRIPFPIWN